LSRSAANQYAEHQRKIAQYKERTIAHAGDFGLQPDNKSSVVQKDYIQY
jgi:hypothetical protein